ncbi:prostaglandin E2 receptor EP3 subtype [Acanthochromis polyacanthus]|uniref:prostaglandin E2 receptor EP3 subtype n=1 Tax=Acanthochromis polyacanthus TaxID=80966 RepID=UPI002234C5FA|nr:prostaglandin E2 receptor EP3 subtype [Acanthochromis polyacanthus]XP_051802719.1 prostaglandin E2 receptor EP3 subtype [Acanthochromis polyacanthus]XP_051802720.1 prostaglandin E2 receptor EP3 subtype [Acanthochromis polyacanthus]XP_051802722.1 prostaglandin E2 receptor EP3 subtype [Acanthochromis polyacanthus]XP_051802723.1 prostaglandin E2 receptor EP3 subtype [Acanthochromis polyacanthus]XP_051802724.1 prostaglandin E2 receptor EP3 subtype [Acanthochromis polyacanthus]XP_051802725.1 pr
MDQDGAGRIHTEPPVSLRMTSDRCGAPEDSRSSFGAALSSNVSKMLPESNVTKSCGSVSVGFPISMMVTGMVGNSLALLLVYISYRKKENRRKKSFLLCIGSLALTDLFGQLLTSPIVISVYRAGQSWDRIDPSGKLCAFFGVCMTTFGLCALFLASAMAIERATAITSPHWYSNHMKTSVTKQTLVLIWVLVLLFALLPVVGVGKYTVQWPGTWCFISTGDTHTPGNLFFSVTFAVLGIFSLLVTFSCNVVTIRGLLLRCRTKSGASGGSSTSRQWERLTTEPVIQLLGIMSVLLVCWSPLLVLMLRMISTQVSSHQCNSTSVASTSASSRDFQLDCNFFLTAIRLASLNQILDPWVYLLLREILLRKFCIVANAVSNCSLEDQKETPTAVDTVNKQNQENKNLCKPQGN